MTSLDAPVSTLGLEEFLRRDHERIDDLLRAAAGAGETVDVGPYEAFRAGLLRHIGVEEKILVPFARRKGSDAALAVARQLRLDHSALVALLVPTPTPAIVERIRSLLVLHNALEEGDGGFYGICAALAGPDEAELVRRAQAAPEVPLAAHYDGPRAFANIERLLRAAGRWSD